MPAMTSLARAPKLAIKLTAAFGVHGFPTRYDERC
jgi:hypothetical protein